MSPVTFRREPKAPSIPRCLSIPRHTKSGYGDIAPAEALVPSVLRLLALFGWGTFESNKFISTVNSVRVAFLVIILPIVTNYVRGTGSKGPAKVSDRFDLYTIRVGIFFDLLGYIASSLARQGKWFTVSAVVAAADRIAAPALHSALTKHVPSDQTGQLLGATGLLHALARVVAPVVFNAIHSATVGKVTQTVYVCLGSTFGIAFIIS